MNFQFASNFMHYRKQFSLTQQQVADHFNLSRAAISKWEKGQSFPDIYLLPKIASYFNCTIDELLGYAPQLSTADIITRYKQLAKDFHELPFDDVVTTIESQLTEYYSCSPFVLKMAQLYINYVTLAPNKTTILERVVELCFHVEKISTDIALLREAQLFQATAYLMLEKPSNVLEILGTDVHVQYGEDLLIAKAHQLLQDETKAKEMMQASMYQHLFSLIGASIAHLQTLIATPEKFEKAYEQLQTLIDGYDVETLNGNSALQFYYISMIGFMMQQKYDKALAILNRYVDCAIQFQHSFLLKGNDLFDHIDQWLQQSMQLASVMPRDEASVKRDIVHMITQNPIFAPLHENVHYEKLVTRLKTNLEASI